jgi:hypothetical protein
MGHGWEELGALLPCAAATRWTRFCLQIYDVWQPHLGLRGGLEDHLKFQRKPKNPRTHRQINMIEFPIWSSEVIFRSFTAEFGGQFQFGGRIYAKDKKIGIHSPWPSWPRGDWLEFWNDYLQFVLYALQFQIWKNWGSLRCVLSYQLKLMHTSSGNVRE